MTTDLNDPDGLGRGYRLTVQAARRFDVDAALSQEERALFDAVRLGGNVYAAGTKPTGGDDAAMVSIVHRYDSIRIPGGGKVARRMAHAGWFRLASIHESTNEGSGYFWLTSNAERVHEYARSLRDAPSRAPTLPPSSKKLTAHQVATLCRIAESDGYSLCPGGYRRAGADASRWTRTMHALQERGLVRPSGGQAFEITEAGRAAARGEK